MRVEWGLIIIFLFLTIDLSAEITERLTFEELVFSEFFSSTGDSESRFLFEIMEEFGSGFVGR